MLEFYAKWIRLVDLSVMLNMAEAIGIIVGVIIALIQLRKIGETRQAELFMGLYETFRDKEFQKQYGELLFKYEWQDFEDFEKKFSAWSDIDAYSSWVAVSMYFEGMGVLVKRKLIDIDLVDDMISSQILLLWDKFGPIVKEYRDRMRLPQLWEWFEYLYNEVKRTK